MARDAVSLRCQRGLSLIDLMVGMALALITVLAITQLMTVQTLQQRLGGSINDAQNNALIAASMVEKDLQMAGAALVSQRVLNCNRLFTSLNGAAILTFDVAAVTIIDGGGANPDTLRVRYGESVRAERPLPLTASATTISDLQVPLSYGLRLNDMLLVSNAANDCTLMQASGLPTPGSGATTRTIVTAAAATAPNFNPAAMPAGPDWVSVAYTPANSRVHVLGQFTQRTYSVDGATGTLQLQGLTDGAAVPVVENIVNFQAQYGIANTAPSNTNTVVQWVNADAASGFDVLSVAERSRIRAVRFALVARTSEADSGNPSAAVMTLWSAAVAGQLSAAQTFTPTGAQRQFRYRTLRMVVPLKNMMWSDLP
jgi:type IV pilus assembly protein PilW